MFPPGSPVNWPLHWDEEEEEEEEGEVEEKQQNPKTMGSWEALEKYLEACLAVD